MRRHSGKAVPFPSVGAHRTSSFEGDHLGGTIIRLFTAPPELDPFSQAAIEAANPALGVFQNAREVLAMAENARRMPSRQSEYENLVLNRRVVVENPFISPDVWKSCNASPGELESCGEVFGGLDLSSVADLTALVLIGFREGKWRVLPQFWLPREGLEEKAVRDKVPYDLWMQQGLLHTTPGRVVSYEFAAMELRRVFTKYNIKKIGFDRWGMQFFRPWLNKAGFSDEFIKTRFEEFGQGVKSMSPAMRDLEEIILAGKLAHGGHPVLSMCMSNCAIVLDDVGNRKPSKKKSTGRIDGAVGLIMAIGVAPSKSAPTVDISTLIV
jgi:phage terminase large subunit-like protein